MVGYKIEFWESLSEEGREYQQSEERLDYDYQEVVSERLCKVQMQESVYRTLGAASCTREPGQRHDWAFRENPAGTWVEDEIDDSKCQQCYCKQYMFIMLMQVLLQRQ